VTDAADTPVRGDIPVIDIAPFSSGPDAERRRVARQVDETCREIGFLVLVGHGVDDELVARHRRVSRAFFAQTLDQKMEVSRVFSGGVSSPGYIPYEAHSVAHTLGDEAPPDMKETFSIGPPDPGEGDYYTSPGAAGWFHPNRWPDSVAGFRDAWTGYYRAMEGLTSTLLELFAVALDLSPDYFVDKFDRHISRLAAVYYPEQDRQPLPGQLRAGAHSDYGSLTILSKEPGPPGSGGLQIRDSKGAWRNVEQPPGCFVVNLGDLMARWTNDHWVSTLHRVVNPPLAEAGGKSSISTVFFNMPNYDAVIAPPDSEGSTTAPAKYPPITAGDYLAGKYRLQEATS
jgi:isopenicillin N synthase-like dioxygenase